MPRLSHAQLQELFAAWSSRLTLYARTWLEHHAAEDVVQNAFIQLMNTTATANPPAWLFRAVRNQALTRRRGESRRAARERSAPPFDAPPDAPIQPDDLRAALERLSDIDREAITLRVWAGLGFDDIAWIWNAAPSTAHRRYVGALETIRQHLEERCKTRR